MNLCIKGSYDIRDIQAIHTISNHSIMICLSQKESILSYDHIIISEKEIQQICMAIKD